MFRFFALITFFICNSTFAIAQPASLPAVLKADKISGSRLTNILDASGNVELQKDGNVLFADQLQYDKNKEEIEAFGAIKIKNYDIGNLKAAKAKVKSDFTSGEFGDATVVFDDGSYISAPKVQRQNANVTIFDKPIFSICPNGKIAQNNDLAGEKRDVFSLKSTSTTINKSDNSVKNKGTSVRFYDVPFLYTPYLKMPLPSSERKSGFLHPSYLNISRLGAGFSAPYYFNIAPEKDLTTTTQYHPDQNHLIIHNQYRHLLKNGRYNVGLELTNNEPIKNNLVDSEDTTNSNNFRWHSKSNGQFTLPKNFALTYDVDLVGDKDYLRDYKNDFIDYTISEVNLDYIKGRDYFSIKTLKIQELDVNRDEKEAPFALPIINYYTESDEIGQKFKRKYSLLVNSTILTRRSGLQYRRLSTKPKITLPYNLNGNLLEASASIQGDFYNLENNFESNQKDNNYQKFVSNYRPEATFKWSLPLINQFKNNTLIFEPLATFAISSYNNDNSNEIPNEDANDGELTYGNLFLSDRFNGFDRNEDGQRATYGFKSSLFSKIGNFDLGLGQSYKISGKEQDVVIRGFENSDKSNIVGQFGYGYEDIFNISYGFQLNEHNYRNDINEISSSLKIGRLTVGGNYILIRKTSSNTEEKEQLSPYAIFNISKKLTANFNATKDVTEGRIISKKYGLTYNGCCVSYSLYLSENNQSNLKKGETSYNISFVIKNL